MRPRERQGQATHAAPPGKARRELSLHPPRAFLCHITKRPKLTKWPRLAPDWRPELDSPPRSINGQTESGTEARRLLQSDRAPCRVMAARAVAGRRRDQFQALRRDRADRRARQVRH